MSRLRMFGWFCRAVTIAVIILTFTCLEDVIVSRVDGVKIDVNPASDHPQDIKASSDNWPSSEKISKDSDIPETLLLKKSNAESNNCDIFYILVSTVDGRVSALDLHKKGSLVWSVQADTRPLYSSSLASMEMIHNGKKMRLIPSLDGALYQFDGDKVEAVPLSAESLLSSTNRLSDDSMIVGSKDMRNFGVNLRTGEIQFTCGSEGCSNSHGHSKDKQIEGSHFMILTRSTQVVRSVDIKNGNEKWNFSVGQHQIRLPPAARPSEIVDDDREINVPQFPTVSTADGCTNKVRYADVTDYENLLQLLVPEGRIIALNKTDSKVSWEHKFDSPIAKAWLLHHDKLDEMNLFDDQHMPSLSTYTPEDTENEMLSQPLLYIGSHQKLLYIQTSPQFESVLKTFTSHRIGHFIDPNLKVSWRPYLNTASVRTPIFGGNRPQIPRNLHSSDLKIRGESTSLTVWNEDYPFDTGYFLYPEFCDIRSPRRKNVMLLEDLRSRYAVDRKWLQVNIWLFWKELIFINMAVLVAVHVLVTRLFRHIQYSQMISDTTKNSESSHEVMVNSDSTSLLGDKISSSEEYVSRFAADFDCLHCLGKGGFGVVFEAVNKVDDQHYAVKRIMLPKSEGAKEKVLREVKALAKLEHTGIVRYFNAWVESPPVGWQEERDKQFIDTSGSISYSNTASHTGQYHPRQDQFASNTEMRGNMTNNNICIQKKCPPGLEKVKLDLNSDSTVFPTQTAANVHLLKQSGSEEFSVHSTLTETSSRNESDFNISHNIISQENLFSFDVNANSRSMDFTTDSLIDSKSSIPFSNYSFNSSVLFSHFSDQSDKFSGDSVVFDSADNRPSSDGVVCHKTGSYSDSVVFEKSLSVLGDNYTEENKQFLGQNDQEHQTRDCCLSLNKNNNRKQMAEDKQSEQALCGTKFFLYIQMQLYRKETLKDWLSNNTLNRDRHTVLDIFDQIVCAVDYVHSQGLMHRDLKPSNIFFTADEIIKVGDFGLVTALNVQQDQESEAGQNSQGRHTAEVGTTLYMSPEQIARRPYNLKIDIFSLGLIFLELLIPFSTQMERIKILQNAKKQDFPLRFNRELPLESALVYKMTNSDPSLRPVTKEILDHSLFLEFAPTRMGTMHRKRTISNNSISYV